MNPARRHLAASLLATWVGLTTALAGVAEAATFDVLPVRLNLTQQTSSGMLTVRNRGAETMRFQVVAHAWTQSVAGEMVLGPTTDIVYFPAMLTIPPGEGRKIRVGARSGFSTVEKSYRVFVEELPPLSRTGTGVRVLTRMGMPIFLEPAAPAPRPTIDTIGFSGRTLRVVVRNAGNAHFLAQRLEISALDGLGQSLFEDKLEGWYILAGDTRVFEAVVPAAACASLASLTATLKTTSGSAAASADGASARCNP